MDIRRPQYIFLVSAVQLFIRFLKFRHCWLRNKAPFVRLEERKENFGSNSDGIAQLATTVLWMVGGVTYIAATKNRFEML
jgi:hypothetical protein